MTYGSDTQATHFSNGYWYLDTGDMQPDNTLAENVTAMNNGGFILRWNRTNASRGVQLFGRLHSDICNVTLYLLPGVRLQIRLNKARPSFYLITNCVNSKAVFKFLDAQLTVRRVRPNPAILLTHAATMKTGGV